MTEDKERRWTPVMDVRVRDHATIDDWLLTPVMFIEPPSYKPDTYYRIPSSVYIDADNTGLTATDVLNNRELSKINKNHMYGRMGKMWLDECFDKAMDTINFQDFIRPLIPNRFDLMERAKNDPKFNCTPSDKPHKANPSKRKAAQRARKARRNNR